MCIYTRIHAHTYTQSKANETPMHFAMSKGHTEAANALLFGCKDIVGLAHRFHVGGKNALQSAAVGTLGFFPFVCMCMCVCVCVCVCVWVYMCVYVCGFGVCAVYVYMRMFVCFGVCVVYVYVNMYVYVYVCVCVYAYAYA